MPGRGRSHLGALLFLGMAAALGAKNGADYPTVPIPPGAMTLQVPLNAFLNTEYLAIPIVFERGFSFGKYEVTNGQWDACHADGGCEKAAAGPEARLKDHPVVLVDWHQAQQYARWLSKKTGRRYRLPTEQEWYYAASEGKGYKVEDRVPDYPHAAEVRQVPKKTWPVGAFGENGWGVADTHGNVWDWTLSCHTLSPQRLLEKPDPQKLDSADCCSTRIAAGENRSHVPDFVADTYTGGCGVLEPAYNLGIRLVLETEP